MLRSPPQRPVSPANTTFSGISSYRSDSYRRVDANNSRGNTPSVPPIDPKMVARTHFDELTGFLASHISKESQGSRTNAREKLTRLTMQQFQELSTDVYDELMRRKNNSSKNEIPFLPVREDFHPKRNQARQKLATLPQVRFKDLSSDVYYELGRRYPEFKEELMPPPNNNTPSSPGSQYDDNSAPNTADGLMERERDDLPDQSQSLRRRPTIGEDREREREGNTNPFKEREPVNPYRRPSQSQSQEQRDRYSNSTATSTGRRPSRSERDRDRDRNTLEALPSPPPPVSVKTGVVIPNKSTMAEEDPIDIPFGDPVGSPPVTAKNTNPYVKDREVERDEDEESDYGLPTKAAGRSAVVDDSSDVPVDRDTYYDKMSGILTNGRTSAASDRSGVSLQRSGSKLSRNESMIDREREEGIKREYEFKIATLQKKAEAGEDRVKVMEEELIALREKADDQLLSMRALQRELDEVRAERRKNDEEHQREVRNWRERLEQSEEELAQERRRLADMPSESDAELIQQLRAQMENLLLELQDLQAQNDELHLSREEGETALGDSEDSAREWKRKYEQAKTELRGLKATSQLYLQAPELEDSQSIPINSDGGVLDIHLTAFQSSIDSLLTIGRTNTPAKVLTPMRAVIDAMSAMLEDVRAYERRPPRGADLESVRVLYEKMEDTLSNLVIAAKNHAQSYGLSPISLLDAAASHVSTTVIEMVKCVHIRRSTKAEQEAYMNAPSQGPMSPGLPMNALQGNFSPKLRGIDEIRTRTNRSRGANGSGLRGEMASSPPPARTPTSATRSGGGGRRQPPSEPSSSNGSMSPPIFDTPLATSVSKNAVSSDENGLPDNPEESWADLKQYLEAQSEQLVYAIQSVLSAVRVPNPPNSLNEHLTQVITIVTSIVAVCKDSQPPNSSTATWNGLLGELSQNCDKLSELQALPPDKTNTETRQQMAKASFQVANAMKSLLKM